MNIRPAIPEDAHAIAHIHVASWQATYPGLVPQHYIDALDANEFTERWRDRLLNDMAVSICVAEIDDALIGFASGGPIRKPIAHCDGELYAIYLLPSMQRKGAGRALVRHIESELRKQGRSHILAWVLRDNPATSFYQRLGGKVVAEDIVEIGGAHLPELAYAWTFGAPGQAQP
jgi:GNAT superfamily N-acetyltransferase